MLTWFNEILTKAVEEKASDVHLSTGSPVIFRIDSELVKYGEEIIETDDLLHLQKVLVSDSKHQSDVDLIDYDFAYEIPDVSRFRLNIYQQRKGISIAIRVVSLTIKDMTSLGLPEELKLITKAKSGIFLVTGPTGSGKSTTLASIVQYMNKRMKKRIITLEDPIEFVYENILSTIEQREIHTTLSTYQYGIRSAMRQDPDVLLVGELRDLETISAALTAAETGHLVLGTLHTTDAPGTIDRIIDAFPTEQQAQVRNQIANLLTGVLSQRLIKKEGVKGLVLASEFMLNNKAIANLIRKEQNHQIHNAMQTSRKEGMYTMQSKLEDLVQQRIISEDNLNPFKL